MSRREGADPEGPLVLVTVGSDHHPFDRLVAAVGRWRTGRGAAGPRLVVQHGTALPVDGAENRVAMPRDELRSLMSQAAVVVCQGGPATIAECRDAGLVPVVVPRLARLGEVVDDHQVAYCRRLHEAGEICLVEDVTSLAQVLDAALQRPHRLLPGGGRLGDDAVARFARVVSRVSVVDSTSPCAARPGRPRAGRQKVLMLGGSGRSGSTLLERMLGEVPGVSALGEVLHLWERGLGDDERCGCGTPFSQCPFWIAVGLAAFGGWGHVPVEEAIDDRRAIVRNRLLPGLVSGLSPPGRRRRGVRMLRRHEQVYAAAADVSGASLLVDSSKHPAFAYLVRRGRMDLRCVLVVRDPRGVAWSWTKTVDRPEVTSGAATMPRYGVVSSALRWTAYGVLFHALTLLGVPVHVVRYEDLLAHPRETVESVLAFAGRPASTEDLAHVADGAVSLSAHHTVAGNPMRFRTGTLDLRADTEWRRRMRAADRRSVELATAPLRRLYGYRRAG